MTFLSRKSDTSRKLVEGKKLIPLAIFIVLPKNYVLQKDFGQFLEDLRAQNRILWQTQSCIVTKVQSGREKQMEQSWIESVIVLHLLKQNYKESFIYNSAWE